MVKFIKGKVLCCFWCNISVGCVYVYVSYNNIIVIIIDFDGNLVVWFLGGIIGYKGSKKGIFYVV